MATAGQPDPSLVLAIEGLRATASVASEVVVASADAESGDAISRAQLATAHDVELCCLTVLGQTNEVPSTAAKEATPAKGSTNKGGLFGALGLPFLGLGSSAGPDAGASAGSGTPMPGGSGNAASGNSSAAPTVRSSPSGSSGNTSSSAATATSGAGATAAAGSSSLSASGSNSNSAATSKDGPSANDSLAVSSTSASSSAEPTTEEKQAASNYSSAIKQAYFQPITDIIAVYGNEPLPEGFTKITQSVTGLYTADLNASNGPKQMWLAVARFPNAPAITGLVVVILELGEFIPPNFQPVRHLASGKPANMRFGLDGEGGESGGSGSAASAGASSSSASTSTAEAYLCFTRSPGAPIVDFGVCYPQGASTKADLNLRRLLPGGGSDASDGEYMQLQLTACFLYGALLSTLLLPVRLIAYSPR
jgi:hypothetical protein